MMNRKDMIWSAVELYYKILNKKDGYVSYIIIVLQSH